MRKNDNDTHRLASLGFGNETARFAVRWRSMERCQRRSSFSARDLGRRVGIILASIGTLFLTIRFFDRYLDHFAFVVDPR